MTLLKIEVFLNFTAWTAAVFYSLYNFYLACDIFDNQEDTYNDFSPGWFFLKRRKDSADFEWQTILHVLQQLTCWCFAHSIIAHFIAASCKSFCFKIESFKVIQYFQTSFSLLFILTSFPILLVVYILIQPLIFRVCFIFRNTLIIWICWLFCLAVITIMKFIDLSDYLINYNEIDIYLILTCMFWMNLKCFSYFIDKLKENQICTVKTPKGCSNLEYLAYCLYLPTLLGGPFLCFVDYSKTLENSNVEPFINFEKLMKNLLCIGFWVGFTEFALHFIYVNPMLYQIEHVERFNSWTFYGYGYAMGQYFHLKYVVLYGFSLSFAEFDGVPEQGRPKCIGRIHVYSDMWKHFDRGFYIFLVRYLYIPLIGERKTLLRQFLASIACFLFVYIWHGIATFILIWTMINLLTVTLEKCFKVFLNSPLGHTISASISEPWKQRLHSIIASPLLAISAMSNSYFFAGREVGDAFFRQFYASDLSAKFTLFFLLYFCCQVSIEARKWEQRRREEQRINVAKSK